MSAVSFTNDSNAIAVTRPVLRCCDDTCRVPNRIENTVMMMQNSSASRWCRSPVVDSAEPSPARMSILSATACICNASSGSSVMHMAIVTAAPTQGLRKRKVNTSASEAS